MLLESGCSEENRLEAVSRSGSHYPAKPPHRLAGSLAIVRKRVEPVLHCARCAKHVDKATLDWREVKRRRSDFRCSRKRRAHYCFFSSIVQMSLSRSPIVK
jgi:hypothetical protein